MGVRLFGHQDSKHLQHIMALSGLLIFVFFQVGLNGFEWVVRCVQVDLYCV